MRGLWCRPERQRLHWKLVLFALLVHVTRGYFQQKGSRHNSSQGFIGSPQEFYSLDILEVDDEDSLKSPEDILSSKHRRHRNRWHPSNFKVLKRNNSSSIEFREESYDKDALGSDDNPKPSFRNSKKASAKHRNHHHHVHHQFRLKKHRNSEHSSRRSHIPHAHSSHKPRQCSGPCKTYSWTRSRKTRRHDRIPAFHSHRRHYQQEIEVEKEPFFDLTTPSVVKAQVSTNAFLTCRIRNIGDKSVSWIRTKDAHILTVDRYTFISDARFVSLFEPETETWTLQVKFVDIGDEGKYECQVTTEPKMSRYVELEVVVPDVVIPGGAELHVRSGSDVNLKCVISRALTPPPHVFWYHEERQVVEGAKGGTAHQAPLEIITADSSVASLIIKGAEKKHAGNYTCSPAGLKTTASVILHVLNGEHPAAMQHGINLAPSLSTQFGTPFLVYIFHISCKVLFGPPS